MISIRDGGLTVISPIDGTPAAKVGIKAQDKIVKIGEESTVNMLPDGGAEIIMGEATDCTASSNAGKCCVITSLFLKSSKRTREPISI